MWYVSTQETLFRIADRFDQAPSAILKSLRRVSDAIKSDITPELLKWPTFTQIHTISQGFKNKQIMKNVIGAIDGTHIQITAQLLSMRII